LGRRNTIQRMAAHVSHVGVHDHGFNNVSTCRNLRRLMVEGKIPCDESERNFYELALKVSGSASGGGRNSEKIRFIYCLMARIRYSLIPFARCALWAWLISLATY
jgi:hypothetical protein